MSFNKRIDKLVESMEKCELTLSRSSDVLDTVLKDIAILKNDSHAKTDWTDQISAVANTVAKDKEKISVLMKEIAGIDDLSVKCIRLEAMVIKFDKDQDHLESQINSIKSILTQMIEGAKFCGTDRIELYTEDYATNYSSNKHLAIEPYVLAAKKASELGLGINAGHDLSLENLEFFAKEIPNLAEVSIGHALISDAIYLGLENTIQMYKRLL